MPRAYIDKLKRALAERALNAEMDHHLDGEAAEGRPNSHNGYRQKTPLTDFQLPPTRRGPREGNAERDVGETGEAAPDHDRSRRRVSGPCQIAPEPRDLLRRPGRPRLRPQGDPRALD